MYAPTPAGSAIRLDRVAVGYGDVSVLDHLDLRVERGELVGVVGPSGSGKTTLLRLLTGRADRHHGRVEVLGRTVGRGPVAGLGYVPQVDRVDRDFPLTVEQVVLLGQADASARRPWFSRRERAAARAVLDRLGLAELHATPVAELSGGQHQRMALARALLRRCELLLLDEPTSGVDLATRRDVLALVGDLHRDGLTVLLTTHDVNFVAAHLPRVICLQGGVTADGPPETVLTAASLERTFGAPIRVLHDGGRVVVVDADPPPLGAAVAGHAGAAGPTAAVAGHAGVTGPTAAPRGDDGPGPAPRTEAAS